MKKYTLPITYLEGIITGDSLEKYRADLQVENIELELKPYKPSGRILASVDEFTHTVFIILNEELITGYLLGLFTNATYDIVKTSIIGIWNSFKGKTFLKMQAHKSERRNVNISVRVEYGAGKQCRFDLSVSSDLSEENQGKCIDEMFKYVNNIEPGVVDLKYGKDGKWKKKAKNKN